MKKEEEDVFDLLAWTFLFMAALYFTIHVLVAII